MTSLRFNHTVHRSGTIITPFICCLCLCNVIIIAFAGWVFFRCYLYNTRGATHHLRDNTQTTLGCFFTLLPALATPTGQSGHHTRNGSEFWRVSMKLPRVTPCVWMQHNVLMSVYKSPQVYIRVTKQMIPSAL